MSILKQNKLAITIVVIALILVIIRSAGINHFRPDAKKWADSSIMRSNIVTPEMLNTLGDGKLLVNLDANMNENTENASDYNTINIAPEKILEKKNINRIRKNDGPVILSSSDPSVSVRLWMVLSQMGIKDLYILAKEKDNESFKNKFRPDTATGPELQIF